ncbi:hypothetical protein D3C80_1095290 [compost metagenome]
MRLAAAETGLVGVAGDVLVVLQGLADHSGDLVVEQLHIHVQVDVAEVAVVAQFARAHAFLVEVARAAGLDEVFAVLQAESVGGQVLDRVAPVDVVLEHVWRAHCLGIHRTQAMARGDQVVDRHARGQRAAGQARVLEHGTALQDPVLVGAPLQLAEQAPGLVVDAAVEVGLRVGAVIAVVHAAEQAQAVGQAQGVLDFQVVAGFAGALVDVAANLLLATVRPLLLDLLQKRFHDGIVGRKWCAGSKAARHFFGEVRVHLPELGQFRAERLQGVTGTPHLLAVEMLGRALDIQAVLGAEVLGPAQ